MKTWHKVLLVSLLFGIPAFLLGPFLWPMAESEVQPDALQLRLLIGVAVIESISFGLGCSFLIFGWPWVKNVSHGSRGMAWMLYIGITWLLISWWPHDRLHMHIDHTDLWSLIAIEYAFHLTLICTGAAIAYSFFEIMQWNNSHHALMGNKKKK